MTPDIVTRARALPGWTCDGSRLAKEFVFDDFAAAFAFMTELAIIAERLDHHPEWSNVYNRVSVELTTHDTGGLSERDLELAGWFDRIAERR